MSSAGTEDFPHVVRPVVSDYMLVRGFDVSGHRRRTLTRDILDGATLVVAMNHDHQRFIREYHARTVPLYTEACGQSAESLPDVEDVIPDFERNPQAVEAHVRATIDKIIAQKIGRETLLPSMEFACEDPGSNSSNYGEGYSSVYTNTIAWASPTKPLPMELNPQVVFERMFGDGASPAERNARRERNLSILDSLSPKISGLRKEFGPTDRSRLDDYAENIREIERRLELAKTASAVAP